MGQKHPALSQIKYKLLGQLVATLLVAGIVAYVVSRFVFSGGPLASLLPVAKIIAGTAFLIVGLHIIQLIHDYVRMSRLLPLMQTLANSYGLQYSTETVELAAGRHRPVLGVIHGTMNGVVLCVFQALERSSDHKAPPKKLTIFRAALTRPWPPFEVQKKTVFGSLFGKFLGAVTYKGQFLVIPHSTEKKSKEEKFSEVISVLSDELLRDFENLPGKNTITVKANSLTIEHRRFIYEAADYGSFLTLLSKAK